MVDSRWGEYLMSGASAMLLGSSTGGSSSLKVTIGAGQTSIVANSAHTFSGNSCSVSGGSGSYTYAWSVTTMGVGTWSPSSSTSSSITPSVEYVGEWETATAVFLCTVTDTVSGAVQPSNNASYTFLNISGAPP